MEGVGVQACPVQGLHPVREGRGEQQQAVEEAAAYHAASGGARVGDGPDRKVLPITRWRDKSSPFG